MSRYNIVVGCGNINCANNKYKFVVQALSLDAAQKTIQLLNNQYKNRCSHCGNTLNFYINEVSDKDFFDEDIIIN
jgi:hypothetical protein